MTRALTTLRDLAPIYIAAVSAIGCASDTSSDRSSLADLLVERYGGDLTCVEAVVNDADDSTADSLRVIAEQGFDVNKWQEQAVLELIGRVMGC